MPPTRAASAPDRGKPRRAVTIVLGERLDRVGPPQIDVAAHYQIAA